MPAMRWPGSRHDRRAGGGAAGGHRYLSGLIETRKQGIDFSLLRGIVWHLRSIQQSCVTLRFLSCHVPRMQFTVFLNFITESRNQRIDFVLDMLQGSDNLGDPLPGNVLKVT